MSVNVVVARGSVTSAVPVLTFRGDQEPLCPPELLETARSLRPRTGLKVGSWGYRLLPLIDGPADRLLIVELPEKGELPRVLRDGCANLQRGLDGSGIAALRFYAPEKLDDETTRAVVEGFMLGDYCFDVYRTIKPTQKSPQKIAISGTTRGLELGRLFAAAQLRARKLANEPGNIIGPEEMAKAAQKIAKAGGLDCRIYDQKAIEELSMGALLAVGRGSAKKPKFVHMVYRPKGVKKPKRLVFVGKAVTFDSGGLSIKTRDGMVTMKGDKTGACNVLGIMEAVAVLKPSLEVHGIFGAVENMPDGDAYRVDDIVKARNGKTIEVKNTDAEGRLTLADALTYACEQKPDALIDMATLTGAVGAALGNYTAGVLGDDAQLAEKLMMAGSAEGERFHFFSLDDDKLRERIDTSCADVKNSAGPGGGAITAAMFLREFVEPGTPWLHLDIAGVDNYDTAFDCYSAGASAFGVRTCLKFVLDNTRP